MRKNEDDFRKRNMQWNLQGVPINIEFFKIKFPFCIFKIDRDVKHLNNFVVTILYVGIWTDLYLYAMPHRIKTI